MIEEDKLPGFGKNAFYCPHCGTFAKQDFCDIQLKIMFEEMYPSYANSNITKISICHHCELPSLWINKILVFPKANIIADPNADMPENIKDLYNEARAIFQGSPRAAAAILRLCIQHLCIHLGESGENLNKDIQSLKNKNLINESHMKALDLVRVIGNKAVHPGVIDPNANQDLIIKLFNLINLLCDILITKPKEINEMFEDHIPDNIKDAIEKR